MMPTMYKQIGQSVHSRIFIKSADGWVDLKLGMVVTGVDTIAPKKNSLP